MKSWPVTGVVAVVAAAVGRAILAHTLAALETRAVAVDQGKPVGEAARRAAEENSLAAPGRIASHSKPGFGAVAVAALVVGPAVAGAAVVLRYSTFSLSLSCTF